MKRLIKCSFLLLSIVLISCASDDNSAGGGQGNGTITAVYRMTWTPTFTELTHPMDYPVDAGFSKIFLMAHSSASVLLFRTGEGATDGLEIYAETGNTSTLELEHVGAVVEIGNDINATESDIVNITITPSTTLMSFIAKISPSPDWFVGVDSFNLINEATGFLHEDFTITVNAYDAGTDGGLTYDSADFPENGTVERVAGDPFVDPATGLIHRWGTLRLERIDNGDQ